MNYFNTLYILNSHLSQWNFFYLLALAAAQKSMQDFVHS